MGLDPMIPPPFPTYINSVEYYYYGLLIGFSFYSVSCQEDTIVTHCVRYANMKAIIVQTLKKYANKEALEAICK